MNGEKTPAPTPPHMPQLDALRAFAVAGVAYHHWMPPKYHFGIPWWAGVPLFFVLSGFLISSILVKCRQYDDRWFAMKAFYARRFLRIFPAFYAVIIGAFVLDIPPVRASAVWHLSYLSNFYFFAHQGWNGSVSHFWSLAVEEQFYLFWPAVVLFAPAHRLLHGFLALCATGVVSVLALPVLFPDTELLNLLPNYNFFALGLGSLLALRDAHPVLLRRLLACSKYAVVVFGLLTALSAWGVTFTLLPHLTYCFMVLFFFWLIDRASHGFRGALGAVLAVPVLLYLGRISYGLYVLHNFADHPVGLIYPKAADAPPLVLAGEVTLKAVITVLVAMASWHILESPINARKNQFPYQAPPAGHVGAAGAPAGGSA